ncbi:MAG: disulfide oxidoreductase [Deinococcales bacterium]
MKFLRNNALYFAWMVAIVAMAGSLYFSEVRHFVPCIYCWYQRILMYPLVILLAIASYRQDIGIRIYVLPMTVLGFVIGVIHYLTQKGVIVTSACGGGVPCNVSYINWLGFITIPFLSLTAFLLITLLLISAKRT